MQAARALAAKVADAAGKAAKTARKPASTPAKAQRPPKLQPVSPTLGVFLGGVAESSRQQTVKHLWDYIKAHRLQDPQKRLEIICDEKLKLVLGKDRVHFKEIPGLLSPHFPDKGAKKS